MITGWGLIYDGHTETTCMWESFFCLFLSTLTCLMGQICERPLWTPGGSGKGLVSFSEEGVSWTTAGESLGGGLGEKEKTDKTDFAQAQLW